MKTTTKRAGNSIHRSIATNTSWSRSGTLPKSMKIKEQQRQRKRWLRKKWWVKLLNKIFNIKF